VFFVYTFAISGYAYGKNVGPQRFALLKRLGIYTIGDIIGHFPRDYEDRTKIVQPSESVTDAFNVVAGKITEQAINSVSKGRIITTLTIRDKSGAIEAIWFNQPYLNRVFRRGESYVFGGRVEESRGKRVMLAPDFERTKGAPSLSFGRIIPIYPATAGVSQKLLRGLIKTALDETRGKIPDIMPVSVVGEFELRPKERAVFDIHFPTSKEDFSAARERLVFEEIFVARTALLKMKSELRSVSNFVCRDTDAAPLLKNMGFTLTNAQTRAINEISDDLRSGYAMNRLAQGDVGSGKTAVMAVAAYIAVKNGGQAAIMAPTEVLARQHGAYFAALFEPLGIKTATLTGSANPREKAKILAETEDGANDIIIGTHALIQRRVVFHALSLVVTDEQHRFGVRQRAALANKGFSPHALVMSATPIPRTLGLILYGDMDVSVIDEIPPGRAPISTYAVTSAYRRRIFAFIANETRAGRQAYIICPAIDAETEQSVVRYIETAREAMGGVKIACLHGKMSATEKNSVMTGFADNDISVLVATTVIEVGVNVPNATIMAIEDAERFGLAQLHQLRGRVGRGREKSYCVLITDSASETTERRVKALTDTADGFAISELDLELRGPGDFFGVRQHGLPEFKIANLYRDMPTLKRAQTAADALIARDPYLALSENTALASAVARFFDKTDRERAL
jgi:ATP-dependent DNA helicase RecG